METTSTIHQMTYYRDDGVALASWVFNAANPFIPGLRCGDELPDSVYVIITDASGMSHRAAANREVVRATHSSRSQS